MRVRLELVPIVILFSLTIAALIFFRQAAVRQYNPAVLDLLTPIPQAAGDGLNLQDGRPAKQTFIAPVKKITHFGLGISNLRHADPQAVIQVRLFDAASQEIWQGFFQVQNARPDDLTHVPAPLNLISGQLYTIEISTRGIPARQAMTLWYEVQTPGNIRLQLLRYPWL